MKPVIEHYRDMDWDIYKLKVPVSYMLTEKRWRLKITAWILKMLWLRSAKDNESLSDTPGTR